MKTTGDGVLVEFASPVKAVRCAIEVQHGMVDRNADVPPEHRIEFRIGINLGDVIVEEGDIYGDGVNVAARLEGIAEPGAVYMSRDISGQYRRSECPVRVPQACRRTGAARLPMANSGKACTLCRFLNLTPPSFEFHLFYDDANRFGGQSEFSPYRGKGEAVASAGIYSGITFHLTGRLTHCRGPHLTAISPDALSSPISNGNLFKIAHYDSAGASGVPDRALFAALTEPRRSRKSRQRPQ